MSLKIQITGGHTSWLNVNIEIPHQTIKKMFNVYLLDSVHYTNKWCFAFETTSETYNNVRNSSTKDTHDLLWFDTRNSIHHFRVWGCEIYAVNNYSKDSSDRVICGYFVVYKMSCSIIRWWNPSTNKITLSTGVKFNERKFDMTYGNNYPGCTIHEDNISLTSDDITTHIVDISENPFIDSETI